MRCDGVDRRRPEQQRVAVGRRAHDFTGADGAVGARLALHDEALAELRFDPGRQGPKYRLRDASRGERDHDTNRLRGPVLGEAGRGAERDRPGDEKCENASDNHVSSRPKHARGDFILG